MWARGPRERERVFVFLRLVFFVFLSEKSMPTLDQLLPLLQAEPEDAFIRYAVAMEYAKQGRHDEALGEFNELIRRNGDYVPAFFMAGRTCEQKGDVEEAKRFYRTGIEVAKRTGDQHAAGEIGNALMMLE